MRDEALVQRVPKRSLQGSGEIKKGMQFQARTDDGMRLFTVTAVIGDMVTLDGNHPLADQTLHFDVEVVSVREATTRRTGTRPRARRRRPSPLALGRGGPRARIARAPTEILEQRQSLRQREGLHRGAQCRVLLIQAGDRAGVIEALQRRDGLSAAVFAGVVATDSCVVIGVQAAPRRSPARSDVGRAPDRCC